MSSLAWATLWGGVLAASAVAFAGLAIVVTIGGYRDIVVLLRTLEDEETGASEGGADG